MRLIDANELGKVLKAALLQSIFADEKDMEAAAIKHGAKLVKELIESIPTIDAVPVVRCKDCVYFRDKHVRTDDGQIKFYEEFPPEAFDALGTGSVTMEYGINVGSQCLVDCNRGYGEDKTVFREADDFCSRGYRKMNKKETEE